MARRTGYALSVLAAAALAVASVGAQAESHVRIIRLSYLDGQVQMQRAGQPMERAMLNSPVTEGLKLVTGNDGLAEVEFENNTSVRLGENSQVQFTKLVVNDAGAKVNEIEVLKGTVYVDTKSNKEDIYRLTADGATFQVHKDTELRLADDNGQVTAAVLKGEAFLDKEGQQVKIGKKETLTLAPNAPNGYEVAKGVEAGSLDRWNNERAAYQSAYSYNNVGVGPKMSSFGYSDLSYYGAWAMMPGVGWAWQPFGVSNWTGWNPYMAGAWMYDPTLGYSWASAYPWGWLPYHYGAWNYAGNGMGWYWVPGQVNTIANGAGFQTAPVVRGPAGWQPPTKPPVVAATAAEAYRPTVRVGMIGNMPATIPGGRPAPDFRSVVPRSNAMAAGTTNVGAKNQSVKPGATFAKPQTAPVATAQPKSANGHVFDAPHTTSTASSPSMRTYGGTRTTVPMSTTPGMGAPSMGAPSMGAPSGGSHASSGAGHSGSPK